MAVPSWSCSGVDGSKFSAGPRARPFNRCYPRHICSPALSVGIPMTSFISSRLILSLAMVAPLLAACGDNKQQAGPPPPQVTVAKPVKQTVTEQDEYIGRFVAVDSVEVRARV